MSKSTPCLPPRASKSRRLAAVAIALLAAGALPLRAVGQPTPQEYIPPDVTMPSPGAPSPVPSGSLPGFEQPGPGAQFGTPSGWPFTAGSGHNAQGQMPGSGAAAMQTIQQAAGGQPPGPRDPLAIIETAKGTIVVRLFQKFAPATVANFVDLVQRGFYNGLAFHRVEPGFCIQGGDPNGNGSGFFIDPATKQPRFISLELSPKLKFNAPGVVAMARFGKNPNTASCQFFITLSPQSRLDGLYSIFGGVVNGMDVVNRIAIGDRINSIKIMDPAAMQSGVGF